MWRFRQLLTASTSTASFDVHADDEPANEEKVASMAVFLQLSLLATAFMVGHWLQKQKVSWLGEAGFALLLGVAVGCFVDWFTKSTTFAQWISFKKEFFFIALLPPIIFDAGFSLKVKPFFQNIGAICAYAFLGTTISTFVIGLIIWVAGWHISAPLTFLEASLYGAIVSATDPVTVLAIFHRLHADENLYALVFGESVLNDAVAIVLYETLTIFLDRPASFAACLRALGTFFAIFIGSMVVGVAFALLASLAVKSKYFRSEDMPLETVLVLLFAYSSYMLADGLKLSGIVSILFCGMVMAHYTRPNLSRHARDRTAAFSKLLATLAETFVFIYIGVSLFLEEQAWDRGLTWAFIGVSLVAMAVSRALNIYPCTALINALRTPEMRVPSRHCFMLWFSGLRGAMAFALSLQAAEDLPTGAGRVILTSTFFIVLITVLVNGGATTYLVEKLELKATSGYQQLLQEEDDNTSISPDGSVAELTGMSGGAGGYPQAGVGRYRVPVQDLLLQGPDEGTPPRGSGVAGVLDPGPHHSAMSWPEQGAGMQHIGVVELPGGGKGGNSILKQSLSRVREANKAGYVLNKLHRLDERFGRHFLPSQMSEDVELAQQVHATSAAEHMTMRVPPAPSGPGAPRPPLSPSPGHTTTTAMPDGSSSRVPAPEQQQSQQQADGRLASPPHVPVPRAGSPSILFPQPTYRGYGSS